MEDAPPASGTEREFDVVVVGAGPGGEVLAGELGAGKPPLRVALVESELIGGECSYYACMPSKALLRPAEVLGEAARVPGAAQAFTGSLDVAAALRRRDEVIHHLDDSGQLPWLAERKVELFRGHGRLEGERRVRVGDQRLVARRAVVLAGGSTATIPPIPGLTEARPWTNREGTGAGEAPERLAIMGGGPVGVELAQAWRSLGSEVWLIEVADRLLAREEPFAGELVAEALRDGGVEVLLGAEAKAVRREGAELVLELDSGQAVRTDALLAAAGRAPRTADLGLETVGLSAEGPVEVTDTMQVPDRPWLYAIGDINGRVPLTHMAKYHARLAARAIRGEPDPDGPRLDGGRAPRVTFTEPQVAAVGLTAATAEEEGLDVRLVDADTQGTAGASFHGRGAPGRTRFVIDDRRGVLVGATFVGPDVAEWLQAATIAVVSEVPLATLAHAVPAFPTRSEIWLELTGDA
ncbi:MAG: NAD(P)/FAD-dependent oxidoreductase [Actinobacteria bacterium]|nr:MAG: NAD(P)/FAD-dependent oxidoreductase [Actinomycetota bacterium]